MIKISRRFTLQILLPVEGCEEDKIYESEDITLRVTNLKQKPDDVYYRCLKEKSVYASFHDVVKFACEKYSLGKIDNFSVQTDHFGEHKIIHEGNRYIVTAEEAKQLEREHISESIYCNVFKECRLSWFYTSIGDELLPDDMAIVDDELIQKASVLVGYESKKDFAGRLTDVIEEEADWEDKFIASLILAKEIAGRVNGRAVLWYD
ncbi:MAG: hypothetical protein E7265_04180 [Lachnospiraceae bacterium]|nr:hypothetical protein [Lachnospiraceae bacterium]